MMLMMTMSTVAAVATLDSTAVALPPGLDGTSFSEVNAKLSANAETTLGRLTSLIGLDDDMKSRKQQQAEAAKQAQLQAAQIAAAAAQQQAYLDNMRFQAMRYQERMRRRRHRHRRHRREAAGGKNEAAKLSNGNNGDLPTNRDKGSAVKSANDDRAAARGDRHHHRRHGRHHHRRRHRGQRYPRFAQMYTGGYPGMMGYPAAAYAMQMQQQQQLQMMQQQQKKKRHRRDDEDDEDDNARRAPKANPRAHPSSTTNLRPRFQEVNLQQQQQQQIPVPPYLQQQQQQMMMPPYPQQQMMRAPSLLEYGDPYNTGRLIGVTHAPEERQNGDTSNAYGLPMANPGAGDAEHRAPSNMMPPSPYTMQYQGNYPKMSADVMRFRQTLNAGARQNPNEASENPNPSGVPMPFYAPNQAPPPAPNQVPAPTAMVQGVYPMQMQQENSGQLPAAGPGMVQNAGLNTATVNFSPLGAHSDLNSYPFSSFLELESNEVVPMDHDSDEDEEVAEEDDVDADEPLQPFPLLDDE